MKKCFRIILGTGLVTAMVGGAFAQDWDSNPSNWNNREANFENNPANFNNRPSNWNNNPANPNAKNGVYDSNGNRVGYRTPKAGGGSNIYSNDGKRIGYEP